MNIEPPLALTGETELTPPATTPEFIAFRDQCVARAATLKQITNADNLSAAVAILQDLKGLIDTTNDLEEEKRKPVNKWLKAIRAFRDELIDPAVREKSRVGQLVNTYQAAELDKQRKEERRLADETRRLADETAAAQRKIEEQQREIERQRLALESSELSKKQRAEAEKKQAEAKAALLAEQLKAEENALTTANIELQLSAPTNIPRGLSTRVRFDFEIQKPEVCLKELRDFWTWKAGEELFKFDRAGFLKALNSEGHASVFHPPEGEQSAVNSRVGIRVFVSVSSHARS